MYYYCTISGQEGWLCSYGDQSKDYIFQNISCYVNCMNGRCTGSSLLSVLGDTDNRQTNHDDDKHNNRYNDGGEWQSGTN